MEMRRFLKNYQHGGMMDKDFFLKQYEKICTIYDIEAKELVGKAWFDLFRDYENLLFEKNVQWMIEHYPKPAACHIFEAARIYKKGMYV
jgi:hypothetical protein